MAESCGNFVMYRCSVKWIEIEADKGETVLCDEARDLGNAEAVLLHVKQKVAAAACAEEVSRGNDVAEFRAAGDESLPALPDVSGGCAVALFGDKGAGLYDLRACDLAVEADHHESSRPQQREEHAPSGERIGEVMQNTGRSR